MGTVILYANQTSTDPAEFLAIFIFAQVCALFVYAFCGLLQLRISRFSLQALLIVVGYVVYCFVRAYVAEKLLWRADAVTDHLLGWRFRSNLLVNLPGFIGSAWVMNVRERSAMHLAELMTRAEASSKELGELRDLYTEQRSYGERELSLEISSARQLLDAIDADSDLVRQHSSIVERLQSAVHHASQAVRAMSQNSQSQLTSISPIPAPFSFSNVVDRVTSLRGASPWFVSVTGFFFAITYATDYDPEGNPLLSSLGIGFVLFAILWTFRVGVLPKIASWRRYTRVLVFEIVVSLASTWWALMVSRGEYANTLPFALPLISAVTSVVLMNIMAFTQSFIEQRADYARAVECRNQEIEHAVAEIRSTMALEESTWKSMFVGNISRTPTAATVLLRTVVENPTSDTVEQSLLKVIDIWESVLDRLRLVT